MELHFGGSLPIVKKCSRYKREKLELLWEVDVGTFVGTYSKT
jgi:hypothetical protein